MGQIKNIKLHIVTDIKGVLLTNKDGLKKDHSKAAMASDVEVTSFEITDYDLETELHPGMRKRQTKEQAIYGVWADSDSDGDGSSKTRKKKSRKKTKNDYTKSLGFVSGGVAKDEDGSEGSADETPEDVSDQSEGESEVKNDGDKTVSAGGSKNNFVSGKSSSRRPAFKGDPLRYRKNTKQFGAWEKHSSGFGSKMLEKMGYTGKGLGKSGDGIIEPITAHKRSGRGAIGAYGSEAPKSNFLEVLASSDEGEEEVKEVTSLEDKEKETLHQWKKTEGEGGKKKPKYVYTTADEILKKKGASGGSGSLGSLITSHTNVKVVDMTGPETKVHQGYRSLGLPHHAKPDAPSDKNGALDIPELIYNLNLLVDLAESEIVQIDRELQHERDNVVNYSYEYEKLQKETASEEIEVQNLEHVLSVVSRCKLGLQVESDEPMTLEHLIWVFRGLQMDYHEEYKMYNLENIVVPLGYPLLTRHFASWQPLCDPLYGIEVVKLWKQLLEKKKDTSTLEYTGNRSMNQFESLVNQKSIQ